MADPYEIGIGDVVQLKSGGPAMTVAELEDEDVNTLWFAGEVRQAATFPSKSLQKSQRDYEAAMRDAYGIGDVAQLKSGGPEMTVTELEDDGLVQTTWFAAEISQAAPFPPQTLRKVD